jgi:hypothetical protein
MEKAMIEVITAIKAMNSNLGAWPSWSPRVKQSPFLRIPRGRVHSHGGEGLSNRGWRMERLRKWRGGRQRQCANATAVFTASASSTVL